MALPWPCFLLLLLQNVKRRRSVWAGPRSGATARRPGMASTGHKVKVKKESTLILVGPGPDHQTPRWGFRPAQAAPRPRDGGISQQQHLLSAVASDSTLGG
ncbi:hypothetical protein TRIATDRAFT_87697 [Trichoderma atroviride IMI 206040]|uniref:Secreted protein n=1 Tax=Hypocrea atroviridis (strain ATCC 20476 / IMI 206040) TaxID=452589 RepID=G9NWT3_HYPAI|nr:uncharacterized protein TRIATDRAFT_87697 [Trichoderma atroviride IMI 206040]EHK45421.1 hypothetical protein TRIATDRAFT_87697 [Trichoderma atroviride IMI 206040]